MLGLRVVFAYLILTTVGGALFSFSWFSSVTESVEAQTMTTTPLFGYAWSSNIGWISLNCNQGAVSTCVGSGAPIEANYQVQINPDFSISGYAWSSNIGWIQFGGLSGCPSGSCDAALDSTTGDISGWARALSHGDGWDGWIALNCATAGDCSSAYNVQAVGGALSGYAWGDDVVGWIDFSGARYTAPCTSAPRCSAGQSAREQVNEWCEVTSFPCGAGLYCEPTTGFSCEPIVPLGTVTATPSIVKSGESVTVTWDITSPVTTCEITQGGGALVSIDATNLNGTIGSRPVTNLSEFKLTCLDFTGNPQLVDTATVRVPVDAQEI